MEFSELFIFVSLSLEIIFRFWVKKLCFWVKKPCFESKSSENVQKPLFWGQKQGFSNIWYLRKIQNLFYSKLSENYEKMTLKSNFGNCEKLVPTWKLTWIWMFGLKIGMQGLIWLPCASLANLSYANLSYSKLKLNIFVFLLIILLRYVTPCYIVILPRRMFQ